MPFEIIRNDITKVCVDAIVNAANPSLLGGGGVDGAIHKAAGSELLDECKTLGGCKVGQAKITKGYNLPAKYVIHTVGPVWNGGDNNEEKLLSDCYKNSLKLAKEYSLESIAFPLISAGAYGFPKDKAFKIAITEIEDFLLKNDMLVYLVIYDRDAFLISKKLFTTIKQYIDDKYIEEHQLYRRTNKFRSVSNYLYEEDLIQQERSIYIPTKKRNLDDVVNQIDETFSQALIRLIDEKGMNDVEVYKRANVDRRLFSKIRNDIYYQPSKNTAIAFAIALRLNLDETKDLLAKAGYALSHSSKFDLIIEYFIEEGNYNIYEINEVLFAFGQKLLVG